MDSRQGSPRLLGDAKGLSGNAVDVVAIGDRGQLNQPHPTGEGRSHLGCELQGNPGLSRTPDAGDRHQPGTSQQLLRLGQLLVPPDERRCQRREVVGNEVGAPQLGER